MTRDHIRVRPAASPDSPLLTRGPAPVSDLARPFKMALPSFVQHLGVLEDCGLVRSKKQGRVRTYALTLQRLKVTLAKTM
jgi:DNA-binding transcriptional ArsR family regulator